MFFLSEKMNFYDLRMPYDSAWSVIGALGNISAVEIESHHTYTLASARPFANYIKRCDIIQEKLRIMTEALEEYEIKSKRCPSVQSYLVTLLENLEQSGKTADSYLETMEQEVDVKFNKLKEFQETKRLLAEKIYHLNEKKSVLRLIQPLLPAAFGKYFDSSKVEENGSEPGIKFCYICGVINTEEAHKFQRLVYRMSRGNSFIQSINIEAEKNADGKYVNVEFDEHGQIIAKSLFFLAFQKSQGDTLQKKLNRLCDDFLVRRHQLPVEFAKTKEEIEELSNEILSHENIKNKTDSEVKAALTDLSECKSECSFSFIEELKIRAQREKCIYENFDKMKLKEKIFHCRVWVPQDQETATRRELDRFSKKQNFAKAEIEIRNWEEMHKKPPTHFNTNDFTAPFLEVVETYGVPRYREINPAYFTISTFPFEFGVMFGDVGHGGLMLAFGSWMLYKYEEIKKKKWLPKGVLDVRYLIFMMGLFAFYCGFTYNEAFAITLKLFSSCHDDNTLERDPSCVYPLGLDPAWYSAKNEISYFNSFKMKLSIIIGVTHMTLGLLLRAANNILFGKYIDLFFEFLPQLLFFMSTFGYMCFAIITKWVTDWTDKIPPSILVIYTGMGITVPQC